MSDRLALIEEKLDILNWMSGNINQCPNCEEKLFILKFKKCPHCGYNFKVFHKLNDGNRSFLGRII